jgi:hypothetical protein
MAAPAALSPAPSRLPAPPEHSNCRGRVRSTQPTLSPPLLLPKTAATEPHAINGGHRNVAAPPPQPRPSTPLSALYKKPRAPSPNHTALRISSTPLQRRRRSAVLALIRFTGAPPSLPSSQVISSSPPLRFSTFPVAFSGQEALLAAAGEPAGKPLPPGIVRRRVEGSP